MKIIIYILILILLCSFKFIELEFNGLNRHCCPCYPLLMDKKYLKGLDEDSLRSKFFMEESYCITFLSVTELEEHLTILKQFKITLNNTYNNDSKSYWLLKTNVMDSTETFYVSKEALFNYEKYLRTSTSNEQNYNGLLAIIELSRYKD